MELHRIRPLLQRVSHSHDNTKAEQMLIRQGGITQELDAILWVQDATDDLSTGKTADRVLYHSAALNELVRLLKDNWFYLDWVLPEHENDTTPESQTNHMAAVKTSDF